LDPAIPILIFIAAAILLSLVYYSVRNGISPMPTSPKAIKALMSLLPSEVHGVIYELGSGWGTLAIPLAKKYPNNAVIGFETSPIPYWVSKSISFYYRNLTILKHDFYKVPLADAGLIVCYLHPKAMDKLQAKFEKELRSGVCIISNTFAIPHWKPEKVLEVNDLYRTRIYLYFVDRK
jgi:hypothetical protein